MLSGWMNSRRQIIANRLADFLPGLDSLNTARSYSLHRAEISVEPIERLFDDRLKVGPHVAVASIPEDLLLVLLRGAQQPEHRTLGCFKRNHEIGSAVAHEGGKPEAGQEIERIDLWQRAAGG